MSSQRTAANENGNHGRFTRERVHRPIYVRMFVAALFGLVAVQPLMAQNFPTADPVLREMWAEGMDRSQVAELGQALLDSIGPRLTGSPGHAAASNWLQKMYGSWGVESWTEDYGTWLGWDRGPTHIDLVEPRVRTLEGTMLAWSGGTNGPVRGEVVPFPEVSTSDELEAFLATVTGRFVLMAPAEMTCRPTEHFEEFATDDTYQDLLFERDILRNEWTRRLQGAGMPADELAGRIEAAGAAGLLTSNWPDAWGTLRVFQSPTREIPSLGLGCEDYGLLFRLAERGQSPVIEVNAVAEFLGDVPAFNTFARIEGTEKPDEYVVLSAHFDSWDGGSGATDNGTGTLVMMEAMRVLRATYPEPKRTILVGHWNGEEQGLNGSRAYVADHPEVVDGLQALFNQDNGTGRIVRVSLQGLMEAGGYFGRWLSIIPNELSGPIEVQNPGNPGRGGSDYAAFVCSGAPAFPLGALGWEYSPYTWHTTRDTYDKVVIDDVKHNATLVAMLAYLASEEPEMIPRNRRISSVDGRTGARRSWPRCRPGQRAF